jgi:hypothetical protein
VLHGEGNGLKKPTPPCPDIPPAESIHSISGAWQCRWYGPG